MERRDRGYYFDPTADEALARVTRQEKHTVNSEQIATPHPNIYYAPTKEITSFKGKPFEPDKVIGNNRLRKQIRRAIEERKKKGGVL